MKWFSSLFVLLVVFGACSPSTKIEKSWREPTAQLEQNGNYKFLIIAVVKDQTSRRVAEDELVKRLNNRGIASYTVLPLDTMAKSDEEALNRIVSQGAFTHLLIMRLADVEKESYYVPGTSTGYYGRYGPYYAHSVGFYSTPGYYVSDKNYFIETMVYSVEPNKLIWSGTTQTINPNDVKKAINDIADVVSAHMKKDGFLK